MSKISSLLNESSGFNKLNSLNCNASHLTNVLYGLTRLRPKPIYAQSEPVNFISCSYQVDELCQELAPLLEVLFCDSSLFLEHF